MEENKKIEPTSSKKKVSKEVEPKTETPVIKKEEVPEEILSTEVPQTEQDVPFLTKIENARAELHSKYKKNKLMSTIITIIVVGLVILAFFLMTLEEVYKYVGYGVAGVTLAGMVVYYVINKNRFPDSTRKYISFLNVQFNTFVYEDKNYTQLEMDPKDKLDTGEISADRIYKDISQTGSRNVVHGIYNKNDFVSADLAVYTRKEKKQDFACFVGKYVSIPNKIKLEGRIIISVRGEKEIDLPTDIDDLENVETIGNITFLAPKDLEYKALLGEKFLKELKKIKIENFLINLNIVVWGGHTAIYMSYSDELMTVPFENPFNDGPLTQYRDNQLQLLKVVDALGK